MALEGDGTCGPGGPSVPTVVTGRSGGDEDGLEEMRGMAILASSSARLHCRACYRVVTRIPWRVATSAP
jgi:hypothetical protein